jgi:hypothetical protein
VISSVICLLHVTEDSSKLTLLICLFELFEIFTGVILKIFVFPDITPCTPLKVNLAFSGLHGVISQKNLLKALSAVEDISSGMV